MLNRGDPFSSPLGSHVQSPAAKRAKWLWRLEFGSRAQSPAGKRAKRL